MDWLDFEGHGVKFKVATRSDICVSYCAGRRHPCRRLVVEDRWLPPMLRILNVRSPNAADSDDDNDDACNHAY